MPETDTVPVDTSTSNDTMPPVTAPPVTAPPVTPPVQTPTIVRDSYNGTPPMEESTTERIGTISGVVSAPLAGNAMDINGRNKAITTTTTPGDTISAGSVTDNGAIYGAANRATVSPGNFLLRLQKL